MRLPFHKNNYFLYEKICVEISNAKQISFFQQSLSRRTGFARFLRPYQRGANQFLRLDQSSDGHGSQVPGFVFRDTNPMGFPSHCPSLDQNLRPFPINLIELRYHIIRNFDCISNVIFREKNYLFDLGIRIFEREQKTKRLIDSLRKGVIKKFPLQSKFLIPDKKGHRIQDYVVGKVLGKGANGVAFKYGSNSFILKICNFKKLLSRSMSELVKCS